ncbi:Oligosaccharyltransferase complex subunit OSTC [Varanus komodoensis]|nr:Oligosaccharyltransferase complex subunit OSTC [Varanus komodoensis]
METLYRVPFAVLECPNIKLKRPSWVHMPSAMTVYALVVVSYFLITGGIIYDVIVEPPSVGSMTDEHGHQRPVAFLAYRVNGQYIMEGLASSFLFTMGGLGFIILDRSNAPNIPKLNRFLLLFIGFVSVLLSFFMARVFMRMKLPQLLPCKGLLNGLVPFCDCHKAQIGFASLFMKRNGRQKLHSPTLPF